MQEVFVSSPMSPFISAVLRHPNSLIISRVWLQWTALFNYRLIVWFLEKCQQKAKLLAKFPRLRKPPEGWVRHLFFLVICFLCLIDHQEKQKVSLAPQGFRTRPYCDVIKYSAKTPKFKDLWYLLSQKVKKKLCDLWNFCSKCSENTSFAHGLLSRRYRCQIFSLSLCILQ